LRISERRTRGRLGQTGHCVPGRQHARRADSEVWIPTPVPLVEKDDVPVWRKLLHVTNRLSKVGVFVQIRWTYCSKTNNFHCCQCWHLIRILPDDKFLLSTDLPAPVDGQPPRNLRRRQADLSPNRLGHHSLDTTTSTISHRISNFGRGADPLSRPRRFTTGDDHFGPSERPSFNRPCVTLKISYNISYIQ